MRTKYTGPLLAQADEGIDKVEWKSVDQVQEALKNSYENIKLLFE
jgi:hypothetical protein